MLDDLGALRGSEQQRWRFSHVAGPGDRVGLLVISTGDKGSVDVRENRCGTVVVGADDDAIRMEEVRYGGSLAKELRIGDDIEEVARDAVALNGSTDPLVGVDRDGALLTD